MPQKHIRCIDCGEPKTTYSQQLSPRCNACSGKQKRGESEYYTHCVDCGAEKPLGTSRRSPRCRGCAYLYLEKNKKYDVCQECGEPKKLTKSKLCWSCAGKKRQEELSELIVVTYSHCQECGQEKAHTPNELCHSCSTKRTWDEQRKRIRTLYDTCQECGKSKTRNDRELCLSCAGKKRMTELYGDSTTHGYPRGWNHNFKEKIRERDGYKCVLCGKTQKENGRALDVHHADGNKKNLDPGNLVVLCMSCHGKTRWHESFWQQVFTKYRGRSLKQDWQMRVVVM